MATIKNSVDIQNDIIASVFENDGELITGQAMQDRLTDMAVSYINRITDKVYLNLQEFSVSRPYAVGECTVHSGTIYQCSTIHAAGVWNPAHFTSISGGGGSGLTAVLAIDPTTGNQIITSPDTLTSLYVFDGYALMMYASGSILSQVDVDDSSASMYYENGAIVGGIRIDSGSLYAQHSVEMIFDSPIYNFASATPNTFAYFDASANLTYVSTIPAPGLASVLGVSGVTGNQPIKSANNKSQLFVYNSGSELFYSDAGVSTGFSVTSGSGSMTYDDGSGNTASIQLNSAGITGTTTIAAVMGVDNGTVLSYSSYTPVQARLLFNNTVNGGGIAITDTVNYIDHTVEIGLDAPIVTLWQGVLVNAQTKLTLDGTSQTRLDWADGSGAYSAIVGGSGGNFIQYNDNSGTQSFYEQSSTQARFIYITTGMASYSTLLHQSGNLYLSHPLIIELDSPTVKLTQEIIKDSSGHYTLQMGSGGGLFQLGYLNGGTTSYIYGDFGGISNYFSNGTIVSDMIASVSKWRSRWISGTQSASIQMDNTALGLSHTVAITLSAPAVTFSSLTASRVPYLDASKNLVVSAVTPTELGYVSGVTSGIQAQINAITGGGYLTTISGITAGGDLSGTYANPTVAKFNGQLPAYYLLTTNMVEGTNLFYTNARVNTQVATYTGDVTLSGTAFSIGANKVTNSMLAGSIAYSKLSLTGSIVNGDIVSLAWSKITSTPTTLAGYGITDAQSALSGTGFVKISGTTISYDNSTYLTTSAASSTYAPLASPTFTGTVTLPAGTVTNSMLAGSIADGKLASAYIYADGTRALSANWNAGAFNISSQNQTVNGTGGNGYMELLTQSSAVAAGATNSVRLFSNAGLFAWIKPSDGFVRQFSSTLTASRTYTLQDRNGTLADDTDLAGKLNTTAFSGLSKISVGTATPGSPSTGDLWIDTN